MKDKLIRGDSVLICFSPKDDDGRVIQLSEIDTLILTSRKVAGGIILFTKNKEDFHLKDDIYSVELLPEDTQELNLNNFCFDIEITLKDGTRSTLLGEISLIKDMTTHKSGGVVNEN